MTNQRQELHWFEKLPEEEKVYLKKKQHGAMNKQVRGMGKYTSEAEHWINQVAENFGNSDQKDWAWNALRGVLHALRDRTPPAEVMQFSAQLPMLIRGLFFEGYQLSNKPEKFHVDELIARIERSCGPAAIDGETAFKAVLPVLYDHISVGEMEDIHATLPKDIRQLWDKNRNNNEQQEEIMESKQKGKQTSKAVTKAPKKSKREEYIDKLAMQLKKWDKELAELEEKSEKQLEKIKGSLAKNLDKFKASRDQLKEKL